MAARKKATTNWGAPKRTPTPRKAKKPTVQEVKPEPIRDTREGLVAEMEFLMDSTETVIRKASRIEWYSYSGPLAQARSQVSGLVRRMSAVLEIEASARAEADPEAAYNYEDPEEIFTAALGTNGPSPTSVMRPARWIEWVGYVPVMIQWGGLLQRQCDLKAVDPKEPWFTEGGYQSLSIGSMGDPATTPAIWAREMLEGISLTREFKLVSLGSYGREKTLERFEAHQWLRDAVAKGPIDPIGLPPKLQAVAQDLF